MANYQELDQIHIDMLKEIGNIGTGNAITALSSMLDKTVRMEIPAINLVDFKDIANFVGGPENIIIGILVDVSGDIDGIMMFIIPKKSARTLLNLLFDKNDEENDKFNEIELSALKEIGNILNSSYLSSLATLINKKIKPSIPYISIDMANAVLSVPAIEFSKVADKVLFIDTVFKAQSEDVSGYFFLVPDIPSFDLILKSMGA